MLGELDSELFRARRLVVDTGIHAKHWTRQQAIDYGIEPSEVERYVITSGQACAYMIGELKILELRDKARKALGEKFDNRAFHRTVLSAVMVPLSQLERIVDEYIRKAAEAGAGGRAEFWRKIPGGGSEVVFQRAVLAGLCVIACSSASSAQGVDGRWDAAVLANGVAVPFRFDVVTSGSRATAFFFDGSRKIGSTSGQFERGRLTVDYDFLNTVLDAAFDGRELRGTYRNRRPNAQPMPFVATRYVPRPATTSTEAARVPQVDGEWVMYRTAPDNYQQDVSWKLHLSQSGAEVSGAILRTSGDTGTLTGAWRDGQLTMSHFAGERPLLFEAQLNSDGTLSIRLDRRYTYRAARSTRLAGTGIPRPPDLSQVTSVKNPREPLHFAGADLDGKPVSDADVRFRRKVVVLTIGGTWCANCHDEAPFLSSLYSEFRARGLEVAGLFFENDADLAVVRPRIQAFARRYDVAYPIIFAGTTDQADAKLSQLRNFNNIYPTTIIIGRDGLVRRVQTGFASTATGTEHERLTREERALIVRLLAEPGQ